LNCLVSFEKENEGNYLGVVKWEVRGEKREDEGEQNMIEVDLCKYVVIMKPTKIFFQESSETGL
jgi:hypothetical protein